MKMNALVEKMLLQNNSNSFLAKQFLDENVVNPRYAVGRNNQTLELSRVVKLTGVIDDFNTNDGQWNEIPLVRTIDVCHDALVVNCSTSISPVSVLRHLQSSGIQNVIGFHQVVEVSEGKLEWPDFVKSMRNEVRENFEIWQRMYDSFEDDISRQTLLDVVCFRLTANPLFMRKYQVRLSEQYFEDFMRYGKEVFVDAGGFDGDTSDEFAIRYADYQKIYFFEPSAKNLKLARQRLAKYKRIEFLEVGLSDIAGTLCFNQEAGSASCVTTVSDSSINVDTLDAVVTEAVSFIKMDLEGWELKALEGAKEHIRRDHPKLAIAVYHDSADFRRTFEFIERFNLKYKIFLRHYTQGWSETVMFFLPAA